MNKLTISVLAILTALPSVSPAATPPKLEEGKDSPALLTPITVLAPDDSKARQLTVVDQVETIRALREKDGKFYQPVSLRLRHLGDEVDGMVRVGDDPGVPVHLRKGNQTVEVLVPAVSQTAQVPVVIEVGGATITAPKLTLKPVPQLTVYLLPHSHTDIGYTEIQTAIETKQVQNLVAGIAAAKRTANYPEGACFVWNVEVLWAADLYQKRLNDTQRAEFLAAVKSGQVVLNGMYLNELTGLCRPEELLELFRYSTRMAAQTGVPVDSVMISDVPGYTWGSVTAMHEAGIRYFSTAPNYFDRIGTILRDWENKPFWWLGPDGNSKVLVWIPFWGYAMSHIYHELSPKLVDDFCEGLAKRGYPYEIAYARWCGHGDNAVPDPAICEFVKDWNTKNTWPHFIISGTGEAFRALEKRYGDKLPVLRGDWTPYWEDGAGSSAHQTAMNRKSADRLSQAETVCAMFKPASYQAASFQESWKHVLLYSEHTWGADCSISQPDSQKTREQWQIKKSYAEDADTGSKSLLDQALHAASTTRPVGDDGVIDVINTLSWPRDGIVTLPTTAGDLVRDDHGVPVLSQRMTGGELAFLAKSVPPFGGRRYTVGHGEAQISPQVVARATASGTLDSGVVRLTIDQTTGAITHLEMTGIAGNFADTGGGEALNDYRYFTGDDPAKAQRNGPVTVTVEDKGPLIASLRIESAAPGCNKLTRILRVVGGGDSIEITDSVDKARLAATNYKKPAGKESLNFAFPFNVPDGQLLLDIPLGAIRPEFDQIPSACKNWFNVSRWADVSNPRFGITWVTLDAPLVQVGGLTANLLESQTNPDVWRKSVQPTQKIYSWAMNNHWGTNYRAYQDGVTAFRFVLRPHHEPDPAAATRFALGFSQELLVLPAANKSPVAPPLLCVEPAGVVVIALKPSDDGKALIVRLFGASGKTEHAKLSWALSPKHLTLSDTAEQAGNPVADTVEVPAWGVTTLRAELH
ncbi:MAG: glycosyl hydrolase-related protein [Verrucomicrobiota bacterium]